MSSITAKTVASLKAAPSGLVTTNVNAIAWDALRLMRRMEVHHLVVEDGGDPVGILSDREIYDQAMDLDTGEFHGGMLVRDIMVPNTLLVEEDTELGDALDAMLRRGVRALPMRKQGVLTVITETDFLRLLNESLRVPASNSNIDYVLSNPIVQRVMKLLSDVGI